MVRRITYDNMTKAQLIELFITQRACVNREHNYLKNKTKTQLKKMLISNKGAVIIRNW